MERFYLEEPNIYRQDEAFHYINEHYMYSSDINGSGGMDKYRHNYRLWLDKIKRELTIEPNEEIVPARTYFLIRENDNKLIGMINIRLVLNKRLKNSGGHIGYGIRPTERNKGYNKINLYLGLKVCDQYGIDKVYLDADINNSASWKTMEALGGKRIKEYSYEDEILVKYVIDVKNSIEQYKDIYSKYLKDNKKKVKK